MSLDNPTVIERFLAWIKTPKGVKVALFAVLGLFVLGAILFATDRLTGWYQARQVTKARQNVNAAAKALQDAQSAVHKDDVDIAVKTSEMNQAVNAALEAVNATDAAKKEIQTAQQNLANAVAANKPVGVTAADLERRLDSLGVK